MRTTLESVFLSNVLHCTPINRKYRSTMERYTTTFEFVLHNTWIFGYISYVFPISASHLNTVGVAKSGCVRECREAIEELYDFLHANNIGDQSSIDSIIDKFTEAGFIDQVESI